jgi:hypothetical protein
MVERIDGMMSLQSLAHFCSVQVNVMSFDITHTLRWLFLFYENWWEISQKVIDYNQLKYERAITLVLDKS